MPALLNVQCGNCTRSEAECFKAEARALVLLLQPLHMWCSPLCSPFLRQPQLAVRQGTRCDVRQGTRCELSYTRLGCGALLMAAAACMVVRSFTSRPSVLAPVVNGLPHLKHLQAFSINHHTRLGAVLYGIMTAAVLTQGRNAMSWTVTELAGLNAFAALGVAAQFRGPSQASNCLPFNFATSK